MGKSFIISFISFSVSGSPSDIIAVLNVSMLMKPKGRFLARKTNKQTNSLFHFGFFTYHNDFYQKTKMHLEFVRMDTLRMKFLTLYQ